MTKALKRIKTDDTLGRIPAKFTFNDEEKMIVIGNRVNGKERQSKLIVLGELESLALEFWRLHRITDNAPSNSKVKTTLKECAKELRNTGRFLKSLDKLTQSLLAQRRVKLPKNLVGIANAVEDVAMLIGTEGGRPKFKYSHIEDFLSLAAEHLLLAGIKCGTDDTTFFGRFTALVCDKLELTGRPDRRHLARKAILKAKARKKASNDRPSEDLVGFRKQIARRQLSTGDNPS